jgi:hypothetical protein
MVRVSAGHIPRFACIPPFVGAHDSLPQIRTVRLFHQTRIGADLAFVDNNQRNRILHSYLHAYHLSNCLSGLLVLSGIAPFVRVFYSFTSQMAANSHQQAVSFFEDSYKYYTLYPTNLVYRASYRKVLESYKNRLDKASTKLFFKEATPGQQLDVRFRDYNVAQNSK